MPQIPVYQREVQTRAIPSARGAPVPGADAFGAGLGNAALKIAEVVDRERTIADQVAIQEADTKLDAWEQEALFKPETGAFARKGKNAFDLPNQTLPQYDQTAQEIEKGLQGRQRQAFRQRAQQRRGDIAQKLEVHESRERDGYYDEQAQSTVASATESAASFYTDPARIVGGLQRAAEAINLTADRKGWSDEQRTAEIAKAESNLHVAVISRMLGADDGNRARNYFAENATKIDGTIRGKIETAVTDAGVKADSLSLALSMKGMGLDRQIADLDKRFSRKEISSDLYDATRQRLEHEHQVRKARDDENTKAALGSAQEWILQNPGKSILDMPSGLYAWAKGNGHLAALQNFARTGGDPVTDPGLYYNLRIMAVENPAAFVRDVDLLGVRDQLSRANFEQLVNLQASVTKADITAQESERVKVQALKDAQTDLRAAGLNPNAKEGRQAEDMQAFNARLLESLDSAQKAKDAPLTREEARGITLGLLKEGRLQGSGLLWDDKKRRFEVTPEEAARTPFVELDYDSIPPADRAEIEAQLRLRGADKQLSGSDWERQVELVYQRALDSGVVKR